VFVGNNFQNAERLQISNARKEKLMKIISDPIKDDTFEAFLCGSLGAQYPSNYISRNDTASELNCKVHANFN
jgi:hypothetical protein